MILTRPMHTRTGLGACRAPISDYERRPTRSGRPWNDVSLRLVGNQRLQAIQLLNLPLRKVGRLEKLKSPEMKSACSAPVAWRRCRPPSRKKTKLFVAIVVKVLKLLELRCDAL